MLKDHGVHEKLVSMVERVDRDNVVTFELGNVVTDWCKSDFGLSPILFNLYVRELGMKIEECQQSFKYTTVNSNGDNNIMGLIYTDDVCLVTDSESLCIVCDNVSAVIEEYGLKVHENKSKGSVYQWCDRK